MSAGLEKLKNNKNCVIQELELKIVPNNEKKVLTVTNGSNWVYKFKEELNYDELIDKLVLDFETIYKNADWKSYVGNKTIVFNLISDESLTGEVVKTLEKNYA